MASIREFIKKKERLAYTIPSAIVATVFGLTLAFAQGCNSEPSSKRPPKKSLLKRALIKGDANGDGIVQRKELVTMLRAMGSSDVIPDTPILITDNPYGKKETGVYYFNSRNNPIIYFREEDLREYLGEK